MQSVSYRVAVATGTAASLTLTSQEGGFWHIYGILTSYDDAPTDGRVKITDAAGNLKLQYAVTSQGPAPVQFDPPLKVFADDDVTVELSSGGASVVGELNVAAEIG